MLAAVFLITAFSFVAPSAPAQAADSTGGARIMPLGDSITDGFYVPGGYRINLWSALAATGHPVDFVGSLSNGGTDLPDHDNEGHSGWRIDEISAQVTNWVASTNPRTVLLHIGSNDVIQNYDLAGAPSRLSGLIDKITAAAPNADVFVASIIKMTDADRETKVNAFNATIPGIVQSKVDAGKHVHFVDMHPVLGDADLADGVHPYRGGYDKMAAKWASAIASVPGAAGSEGDGIFLPTNTNVSLRVTTPGYTDRYARHQNSLGYTEHVDATSSDLLKSDATFRVVPGLAGNCYSLQSRNYPNSYLRHQDYRVKISPDDGTALMHSDATWCARSGAGGGVRLFAYAFQQSYLRHYGGELYLANPLNGNPWDNANSYVPDITWALDAPWKP